MSGILFSLYLPLALHLVILGPSLGLEGWESPRGGFGGGEGSREEVRGGEECREEREECSEEREEVAASPSSSL